MAGGNNDHYSGGGEKTIVKSVILRKYLGAYLTVMKDNWDGQKWYVDTHAGTGFSAELDVEIPGSALRAMERDFDRFYFYEYDDDHFDTLVKTLNTETNADLTEGQIRTTSGTKRMAYCEDPYIRVINMDCNEGVSWLAKKANSNAHWFTFVDPEGFSVERQLMQTLRERGNMDILFNFQTEGYYRNTRANASGNKRAVANLGKDIPDDPSKDELVKWYEETMFRDHGWNAAARSMTSEGSNDWRYDLIFASENTTAVKIILDIYGSDLKNDVTDLINEARAERSSGQAGLLYFNPDERAQGQTDFTDF